MSKIKIREYETHDFAAVLGLWELTGLADEKRADSALTIEKSLQFGGKFWILEDLTSDECIGTIWLTNDSRRLYLHHLGVHPNYQQKGYGRLLSEKALQFAKKANMQIKLEVHEENKYAIKLYQKLGFKYLDKYDVMIKRKH
ncbi:GNAT family N-acetyltransferase [Marinifilum flexuosum]|uniref:Ribosomal protein S18 acetylase RimI-like enzyme n=1 Tax=Marinifilum flexuosum TaxID=1117708 RepID=A0A419WMW7_9BACT|nr:GNAT family N-acetyltransferase [Marinifilum flexuosum]RKD96820.1 ribosomal protein S18 acetylase RimI-like enzyme [Marinifilum flexuosum]